jgi:heme-degrading monooxygenase HmoA
MIDGLATNLTPPYWAVIFASKRTNDGQAAYETAARLMGELAAQQPGYLGIESTRGEDGLGITVSYWTSEEAIVAWKNHVEHTLTRERGRADWYEAYTLRVARVERAYEWTKR